MRSEGLEPPTYKFVACCSIQLSYDRIIARRADATLEVPTCPERSLPRRGSNRRSDDQEREGFEPSIRCYPYNDLANRRLQPLGHLSAAFGFIHAPRRRLLHAGQSAARVRCSRVSSTSTRSQRWATTSRKIDICASRSAAASKVDTGCMVRKARM